MGCHAKLLAFETVGITLRISATIGFGIVPALRCLGELRRLVVRCPLFADNPISNAGIISVLVAGI